MSPGSNGPLRKMVPRTLRCRKQLKMERPCTCAMGNVSRFIEPVVLRILKERKTSYGYEIAECIPRYALTDATIEGAALYRTLRTLEANGYVSSTWKAGSGPARRTYSLTRLGHVHLREWTYLLKNLGEAMIEFARHASDGPGENGETSAPAGSSA